MAKQKERECGRIIDLARYYPEYLKDVTELQQISSSENAELGRLYQKSDGLWADGFIQTASIQGIKRWETLLGIRPYPGDSVEERRAAVLTKWNQQLPYTLTRLQERLDTVVEPEGYELAVRYHDYELDVTVIDRTLRVLQDVKNMTENMIPANLLLLLTGKYPDVFAEDVKTDSGLIIQSSFNPRYNREYLMMDGSWDLDGTYILNGYRELTEMDFYPYILAALSEFRPEICTGGGSRFSGNVLVGEAAECIWRGKGIADASGMMDGEMTVAGEMTARLEGSNNLVIYGDAQELSMIRGYAGAVSFAASEPDTVSRTVRMRMEGDGSAVWGSAYRIADETELKTEVAGSIGVTEQLTVDKYGECISGFCSYQQIDPSCELQLKVEKNLWHMDGSCLLNGSRLLNASIIDYHL